MSTAMEKRVLVLDDDDLILRAMSRSLRAAGFVVHTTTVPDECRALLQTTAAQVVVSDLNMPAECGARFLSSIAIAAPHTVRVLMSADPEFSPKVGTPNDSQAHVLLPKANLPQLPRLLTTILECRQATPEATEDIVALATRLADAFARPAHETGVHRERLSSWTKHLAHELGLSQEDTFDAYLAAVLHDVGQMAVPARVFEQPDGLTSAERAQLERHPREGARILSDVPALRRAAKVVLAHHQRYDGGGYPAGEPATEIPRGARVLHVVDAYDAMTSPRAHRPARPHDDAVAELRRLAGSQFDPAVVEAFAGIGEGGLRAIAAAPAPTAPDSAR